MVFKVCQKFPSASMDINDPRRRCVATMQASVRVSGTDGASPSPHAATLCHKMVPTHHCIAVCCSQHIVHAVRHRP